MAGRPLGPLTSTGYLFLAFALAFGMSTTLSTINLLYWLFGILLCLVPLNGFLAWLCVWRVGVTRQFPLHVSVGEPTVYAWAFHNRGRFFSALSVELREVNDELPFEVFVDCVHAGATVQAQQVRVHSRRGIVRCKDAWLVSTHPFGFTQRYYKVLTTPQEVLVWPYTADAAAVYRYILVASEAWATGRVGYGDEFFGLREFRHGDAPNRIHHRSMARVGRPVVMEFESGSVNSATLRLEKCTNSEQLEKCIVLMASAAKKLIEQGWGVELQVGAAHLPMQTGNLALYRVLDFLALVQENYFDNATDPYASPPSPDCPLIIFQEGNSAIEADCLIVGADDWHFSNGIIEFRSFVEGETA